MLSRKAKRAAFEFPNRNNRIEMKRFLLSGEVAPSDSTGKPPLNLRMP
jgi:hypothetical protein